MANTNSKTYDLIVIGAGAGGLTVAMFMSEAGFQVLLVEKEDRKIGGECLNDGCVPSKSLIYISRLVHNAKQAGEFGLTAGGEVDMDKVANYINSRREIIRQRENAEFLQKHGVEVVLGEAKFASPDSITVNGQTYSAKRLVVATGSRPRRLKIPGVDQVDYFDNQNFFDIRKLPQRLLVIGGGPIGTEIGQAMQRLGSQVTIVQREPQFLPKEDPVITAVLQKQLEKEGLQFHFQSEPRRFLSANQVEIENAKGHKTVLDFDAVMVAIGRDLNIDLDLDKAGIEAKDGRIVVDGFLRTTNKQVFVVGDVAGSYQFTHAAELQARAVLQNFTPWKKKISYDHLSWVTFTWPEIATFGLNPTQLKERGIVFDKLVLDFAEDDRHVVEDFPQGKMLLYVDRAILLGGSVVAPQAGEIAQELILLNTHKIPINKLFSKTYPYPVASRVNQEIVANLLRERMGSNIKKLFKLLY